MIRKWSPKFWIGFAILLALSPVVVAILPPGPNSILRRRACEALVSQLNQALHLYRSEYGELPPQGAAGLYSLSRRGKPGSPALFEFRKSQLDEENRVMDPWSRPIVSRVHREEGRFNGKVANLDRFELYSVGPNGKDEGGKGDDVTVAD